MNKLLDTFVHFNKRAYATLVFRLAGVLVALFLLRALSKSGQIEHGPVLCPFRLLTGHLCPLCGTTRAIGALCAGEFTKAWNLNPVGLLLSVGVVGVFLSSRIRMLGRRVLTWLNSNSKQWSVRIGATSTFLAIWVWNFSRW